MKNKKSLSNVIATVLLIALTLTVSVIIFAFSKNLIKNIQLSPTNCQELKKNIEISYVNYNQDKEVSVQVTKLTNEEINRIDFTLHWKGNEETWTCSQDCQQCRPQKSLGKTYILEVSNKPEKVEVKVDRCLVGKEKSLYKH